MYNDHKVKVLHIMIPKTSAYVKGFDGQTKLNSKILFKRLLVFYQFHLLKFYRCKYCHQNIFVLNCWKSYKYLLFSNFKSFLLICSSIFFILLNSFLISLFSKFFGKISSIDYGFCLCSAGFKTFEVSTCFSPWSSFVFLCSSKSFPKEEW